MNLRRTSLAIAIVASLLALSFFCGPLFHWDPKPSAPPILPANRAELDSFLSAQEDAVGNVKPDLRKGIIWDDPVHKTKTPLAIVYLHGFSASRGEMSPVFEQVATSLGANIYFYRLKGHALTDVKGEAFATVHAQDWVEDAREALAIGRMIGERVILAGMSTGAALAIELAYENLNASDIAGLVLVSPNFAVGYGGAKYLGGPLGLFWARIFIGRYRSFPVETPKHDYLWTHHYRVEGVPAVIDLTSHVGRLNFADVKVPAFVLYTKYDAVVSVPAIEEKFEQLGSPLKKKLDLPQATRHELAGEALSPEVIDPARKEILSFISSPPARVKP
jgi:alpha-beta hydrolase superfamily lysophospholipase